MYDKKSDPVLTDYDITINSIHQENMFKGTIAVCIVYAIFAFILVAAAYFSDNIRELLFDKFLPFTLVYIIGTIVIIMIFIYFIVSFVPKKVDNNKIDDSISCPDYWKLEILDDKAIEKSFDTKNFNKKLFKYRCVMDDAVFNKGTIYKQDKNSRVNQQYRLGNKPAFIGRVGTGTAASGDSKSGNFNDIYDAATANTFLTNTKENDKYFYLYKNLNAYNNSNLSYTNNNQVSDKILDELKVSALIMNNYKIDDTDKNTIKYVDITNAGTNKYQGDNNNLNHRYTSNYYNSPAILTWSASDAYNVVDRSSSAVSIVSTSYYNTNIANDNATNTNYTATVYDWSTMTNKELTGNVYAIDTTNTSTANHVLLGEIKNDNNNLYFEGGKSITIPTGIFSTNTVNKNYYFDKTYLFKIIPSGNILSTNLPTLISGEGPKIRIFNKTERDPEISKADINKVNANKLNIPLTCSAVYPSFLASKEDKFSENNTLRCAYSKICNIPWSDLHCNEFALQ